MYRIGTTSYIIPADILPNVEFLAGRVQDIQLVLFETDGQGSNLPDAATRRRLLELKDQHSLTYTVHLPLDLRLGDGGSETDLSLAKARRVIDATRELTPFAYTAHLDGRAVMAAAPAPAAIAAWQETCRHALAMVCGWLDDGARLCVENIERWDPELLTPLIETLPISLTVDVGHLWLQGADPVAHLRRWRTRTRVVHLHGIAERDHASLACMPPEKLDPVVAFLRSAFAGVLTLEVFSQTDLETSLAALEASMRRGDGVLPSPRTPLQRATGPSPADLRSSQA